MSSKGVGLAAIAAGVVLLTTVVAPAIAAGETGVELDPANQSVHEGQNATYNVVVTNASNGVGAVDLELTVTDTDVASFADVTYEGNPNVTHDESAGWAIRFVATGMDTAENGSITVGSVQVSADAAGTTDVEISPGDLSDESGRSYSITGVHNATLAVEAVDTPTGGSGGDGSNAGSGGGGGGGDIGGGSSDSDGDDSTETESETETDETSPGATEDGQTDDNESAVQTPDDTSTNESDPVDSEPQGLSGTSVLIVVGLLLSVIAISALWYTSRGSSGHPFDT